MDPHDLADKGPKDPKLNIFKLAVPPPTSKFSKLVCRPRPALATLKNFEIGGAPTKFKVFKVGVPAQAGARNFENFDIDGAPTKVKVFKVGPSARGPRLPKACPATAGPSLAA